MSPPTRPAAVRWATAVYATLVRLLPERSRDRWADESMACFAELARAAHARRGAPGVAGVLARSTGDLLLRLPREYGRGGLSGILVTELRYALRTLRRARGFTLASALTLALGFGAALSVFTLVWGVLLRPLPYAEPDRLVVLDHVATRLDLDGGLGMTHGFYRFYAERLTTVASLGAYGGTSATLTGGPDGAVRLDGARATPSLVPTLGTPPVRGRWFTSDEGVEGVEGVGGDDGPVVVVSHRLWRDAFGADPGLVGRSIELEGVPRRVVGVMGAGFAFPDRSVDFWIPWQPPTTSVGGWNWRSVARLAPGVEPETVRREMAELIPLLVESDGSGQARSYVDDAGVTPEVAPLHERVVGDVRSALLVLLGTVGFVLLVALANVANLFLVRAEQGRPRTALRRALGASSGRIAGGRFLEALLLTGAAGVLGTILAWLAVDVVRRRAPVPIPRLHEVGVDATLALVATGLCLLVALALGMVPALSGDGRPTRHLGDDGGRTTATGRTLRGRNVLVAAQTALALVLLVGSGLLLRTFDELRSVDLGFSERDALTFTVGLPQARYGDRPAAMAFQRALETRLAALPGVRRVGAVAGCLPLSGNLCWGEVLEVEGGPPREGEAPIVTGTRLVTPGYFQSLGIPVRGRAIEESDLGDAPPVAVLSRSAADRYFPGEDPVGRRVSFGGAEPWYTVVGVAGDVRARVESDAFVTIIYLPARAQARRGPPPHTMAWVLATSVPPASLVPAVRESVAGLDPGVPVADVATIRDRIGDAIAPTAFSLAVIGSAALIALLLGAVGVYAVTSYVVNRRTTEIGIRMALGAAGGDVRRMVLRQGGAAVGAGLVVGLVNALLLSRFLEGMLHGVPPTDPATYAAITGLLVVVAVLALWWPARRASRLDPANAIRNG